MEIYTASAAGEHAKYERSGERPPRAGLTSTLLGQELSQRPVGGLSTISAAKTLQKVGVRSVAKG